jgi:hypothetical protein
MRQLNPGRMAWQSYAEPALTAARNGDVVRQRRHRAREKSGKVAIQVEVDAAAVIELLVEAKCLDMRRDYFSRQDIAAGIERFLSSCSHA